MNLCISGVICLFCYEGKDRNDKLHLLGLKNKMTNIGYVMVENIKSIYYDTKGETPRLQRHRQKIPAKVYCCEVNLRLATEIKFGQQNNFTFKIFVRACQNRKKHGTDN